MRAPSRFAGYPASSPGSTATATTPRPDPGGRPHPHPPWRRRRTRRPGRFPRSSTRRTRTSSSRRAGRGSPWRGGRDTAARKPWRWAATRERWSSCGRTARAEAWTWSTRSEATPRPSPTWTGPREETSWSPPPPMGTSDTGPSRWTFPRTFPEPNGDVTGRFWEIRRNSSTTSRRPPCDFTRQTPTWSSSAGPTGPCRW